MSLTGRGSTLLAFLTTSCLTCRTFWAAFADPSLALPAGARLVIVTKGPEEEQPEAIVRLAPPRAVTLRSSEAWATLGVPVAPFFMLFGPEGRVVGEGAAATWDQVVKLLTQSLADDELVRDDARAARRRRRAGPPARSGRVPDRRRPRRRPEGAGGRCGAAPPGGSAWPCRPAGRDGSARRSPRIPTRNR